MGNGTIGGKGTSVAGGPGPIASPEVQDAKKQDAPKENVTSGKSEQERLPPGSSGRSAEGLAHDPAVAMRKAALDQAAGLKKPSKAQLEEIRNAIKDGKKEEAVKLTIKYYNIDTSGAHEVKYAGEPKKKETTSGSDKKETVYEEIGTATKNINGRITIEIGDESFRFKGSDQKGEGAISPEWLAAAIFHESFHAKNHFKPDKPAIVKPAPDQPGTEKPKMSQEVILEEMEAYAKEQKEANKLGLTDDMVKEINDRKNKLYAQLTEENRDIVRPMLRGTEPWPHQRSQP